MSICDTLTLDGTAELEATLSLGKADVNEEDCDGVTAMMLAAEQDRLDVMRLLHRFGAQVNHADRTNRTPLHVAAFTGSSEVASALLAWGARINALDSLGQTPLLIACDRGAAKVVNVLLSWNAPLHTCSRSGTSPAVIASRNGHEPVLASIAASSPAALFMADETSATPFLAAASCGQLAILKFILSKTETPEGLVNAVSNWAPKQVENWLKRFGTVSNDDRRGGALHWAAAAGHCECVRFLVSVGANVHLPGPRNLTASALAATLGQATVVAAFRDMFSEGSSS